MKKSSIKKTNLIDEIRSKQSKEFIHNIFNPTHWLWVLLRNPSEWVQTPWIFEKNISRGKRTKRKKVPQAIDCSNFPSVQNSFHPLRSRRSIFCLHSNWIRAAAAACMSYMLFSVCVLVFNSNAYHVSHRFVGYSGKQNGKMCPTENFVTQSENILCMYVQSTNEWMNKKMIEFHMELPFAAYIY